MALLKNIVVLIISLAVAIILAELMVRVIAPQETGIMRLERFPAMYETSNTTAYTLIPNASIKARIIDGYYQITTNALGMRGDEVKSQKPVKAMLLGDSMTFGQGLNDNETISALMERLNPNITVMNTGVPGYAPDQEGITLRQESYLKPDFVFWIVFLGNDIEDVGRHNLVFNHDKLISVSDPEKYVDNGRAVHNVSRTIGGWWNYVSELQKPLDDNSQLYALIKSALSKSFLITPIDMNIFTLNDTSHKKWQNTTEKIVKEFVSEADNAVILVLLPAREQINSKLNGVNNSREDWTEFAEKNNITLIDMYPKLAECGQKCYFKYDGHLNPKGAEIVAQRLTGLIS